MSADVSPTAGTDPFDLPRLCRYFSERSPQPMVAVGGLTHIVRYFNPAFVQLTGRAAADLLGRPFTEAVPGGASNRCGEVLDRVFRTGVPEHLPEQEHRQTPSAYWSHTMWAVLGAGDRPAGVMVQIADATEIVTFRRQATAMNEALLVSSVRQHELAETVCRGEGERRELERQLFRAQKLESLGVLASGIAHDLNNMLTPVLGFAELARASLPDDSPASAMLDVVATNGRRAADLVQQVLAYAGVSRSVVEPIDLSGLVRGMYGALGSVVSVHTELLYDLAPALPAVEGDAAQLRGVVTNLVVNASEAIGTGGTITLRTGRVPAGAQPPESRWGVDPQPGPSVYLEVADTGCGMATEVVERMFDPFFTTKFIGRGLGLAVVLGIARAHGGGVQVHSEPGRGSTIRLILPASAGTAPSPAGPDCLRKAEQEEL